MCFLLTNSFWSTQGIPVDCHKSPTNLWVGEWVGEWVSVVLSQPAFFLLLYHGENRLIFNELIMRSACFVVDQHVKLDFCRHVATIVNIVPIPSQPIFALSPCCCELSGKATNTNLIVFVNHYTTDVVPTNLPIHKNKWRF